MNGTRLAVSMIGGDAGIWVEAARLAELHGVDLWIGDGRRASGPDDSYVLAAGAAVAAVTEDIRLCVVLTADGATSSLRLAEDIGVVDQASHGRLEIAFRVPSTARDEWEDRVVRLLGAWHEWPAQDGRTVAATPRPAQPWIPRLVAGDREVAERLRAGLLVNSRDRDGGVGTPAGRIEPRTVLEIDLKVGRNGLVGWLGEDPIARVAHLRAQVDGARAHELVVRLQPSDSRQLMADIQALGVVVGPCIRCSAHQAPFFAKDTFLWLTEKVGLHAPPV
jgi:hypothetical protein